MSKFWLKKVLYFIPSLLVLSLLCFTLSRLTPDDPVLTEMDLPIEELSSNNKRFEEFRNQYIQITEKNGYHLPLFYISNVSFAGSGKLENILYLPERKVAKKILAHTGNSDVLQDYLKAKKDFLAESTPDIPIFLGQTLDTASSPATILTVFNQIRALDNFIPSSHSDILYESILQLNSKKDSWKSKIPMLRWNGSRNQYHLWISEIIRGNWGNSSRDNRPVWQKIWPAFKWTVSINAFAILMIVLVSMYWGIYTSTRAQHWFTKFSYTLMFLISSLPIFLIAIIAMLVFTGAGPIGIFPTPGAFPISAHGFFFTDFFRIIPFLILPLLVIILCGIPGLSRQVNNIMSAELQKEYVSASVLRGVPARKIIHTYAWKNALGILSVYLGRLIPALVSGSIVIESIFNLPGLGSLLIGSIITRDTQVVFGIILLGGSFSILGLLIADAVMYKTDPNILQKKKIPIP
ncbi:MAG: ABC transporter permease [Saprospiraceae bacterium]|nr:ABC transporter permease [Saprospiraceae bacterium]